MQRRIVIVHKEKCNPEGCGGYLCARVSPSNRAGKEAFYKDSDGKIGVNEELVSDIDRIAVNKCPFDALKLVNLPEALTQQPIHRYRANGFALFNIPIPVFGSVVGLIGRNGIGKSTALRILAGQLTPNLGRPGTDATMRELIERFRGSEAQGFFERHARGEITMAYKPQQVEAIPKHISGTVRELLSRADERGAIDEVASALELTKLLDRRVDQISGGELQRVAIGATALKKANVYFFDEPTSYLDIKQRLRVAQYIRSLADEKTAVMVVEHDLIILDAMTDQVHLMYGREEAFGIVSQPRSAKAGINTYLSGYLREENMRFRDNAITFETRTHTEQPHTEQLVEWPAIEQHLGEFTLRAGAGGINRYDVIGMLGENGIGKTSMVKAIAEHEQSVPLAYKPQYLESDESPVAEVLATAIAEHRNQLIRPLALEPLLDKRLDELSGGQLQRVHLAATLAKQADLYLLDEPATYLDVEQRLVAARIIADMMQLRGSAALIVDHDLLFLDYLSQRLIVFEGESAIHGEAHGPYPMEEGMNRFLRGLAITFRRDEENHRPRVNKPESQKDREQKASGKLYYP